MFRDPDVTRVEGSSEPDGDIETVVTELILADLQTLEKAAPRLAKETKFSKDPGEARDGGGPAQAAVAVLDAGEDAVRRGGGRGDLARAALREART